jgi:alkylhydroperoxidase/carboxymuconolactone decarboxylase family protein YurZ
MDLASENRVLLLDPVFGPMGVEAGREIWTSNDLTARERAILLIAGDVVVPELGLPFELHVEMAVAKVEMPIEHIREILRHIAPDAGLNITAMAFQKLEIVLAQFETEPHRQDLENARATLADGPFSAARLQPLRIRDPVFADLIQRRCNRMWSRPLLSARERAFATLAVDVIGGTLGAAFSVHLAIARSVGLVREDVFAMLRVMAEFSIPKAWEAHVAFRATEGAAEKRYGGDDDQRA